MLLPRPVRGVERRGAGKGGKARYLHRGYPSLAALGWRVRRGKLQGACRATETVALWNFSRVRGLHDFAPDASKLFLRGGLSACAMPCFAGESGPTVKALKIAILSTMLADYDLVGEWGFSALVEVDGRRFLFDSGSHPDFVLRNAKSLGIDLAGIEATYKLRDALGLDRKTATVAAVGSIYDLADGLHAGSLAG